MAVLVCFAGCCCNIDYPLGDQLSCPLLRAVMTVGCCFPAPSATRGFRCWIGGFNCLVPGRVVSFFVLLDNSSDGVVGAGVRR